MTPLEISKQTRKGYMRYQGKTQYDVGGTFVVGPHSIVLKNTDVQYENMNKLYNGYYTESGLINNPLTIIEFIDSDDTSHTITMNEFRVLVSMIDIFNFRILYTVNAKDFAINNAVDETAVNAVVWDAVDIPLESEVELLSNQESSNDVINQSDIAGVTTTEAFNAVREWAVDTNQRVTQNAINIEASQGIEYIRVDNLDSGQIKNADTNTYSNVLSLSGVIVDVYSNVSGDQIIYSDDIKNTILSYAINFNTTYSTCTGRFAIIKNGDVGNPIDPILYTDNPDGNPDILITEKGSYTTGIISLDLSTGFVDGDVIELRATMTGDTEFVTIETMILSDL